MPHETEIFGTPEWASAVFMDAPARALKGHSKYTQTHRLQSKQFNRLFDVQGDNESSAAIALEYLYGLGLVNMVKAQPFITDKATFGREICPDFMIRGVGRNQQLYILEVKSAKFLTRKVNLLLEENRQNFERYGLKYLVWTDQRPLNHATRANLLKMRISRR
jgi:hypothetical protein